MRGKKKLKEWKTLSGIEREKGFLVCKIIRHLMGTADDGGFCFKFDSF